MAFLGMVSKRRWNFMPGQEIPAGLILSMCGHWSSGIKISAWAVKWSLSPEMWERGRWDSLGSAPRGSSRGHVAHPGGDSRVSPEQGCPMGICVGAQLGSLPLPGVANPGIFRNAGSSQGGSGLMLGLGISLQEGKRDPR